MTTKLELLAAFAAAVAAAPKLVEIDGYPPIYVRMQTVGEVDEQQAFLAKNDPESFAAQHKMTFAVACFICDADGNQLLDPNNKDEMALLMKQPWDKIQKLLGAVNINDEINAGN